MKQISYLKSFKVQEDDYIIEDDNEEDCDNNEHSYEHMNIANSNLKISKKFFQYIKYAIENASNRSNHVSMQPCYGFDITPSSGCLLDANGGFIETSLPVIKPPRNDFHLNLLNS
jgi:hypothetical protein